MAIPDFTNLDITAVVATLLLFAAIDTGVSILVAIAAKNFNGEYVVNFLTSHILKVAVPILGLAVVGHGVAALGIPAIPAASLAATAALAAYAVATLASLQGSFADKSAAPAP